MKISALQHKLTPALPTLRCPLCAEPFAQDGAALHCSGGHTFDLAAKGYVNLSPGHDQSKEKYDADLFASRSRVFEAGFYLPVLHAVETLLHTQFSDSPFTLADIGCGEGYYAKAVASRFANCLCFGVDLSRDGIALAARGGNPVHWLVGDLKRLPFAEQSLDALLDILTPADYTAFKRVLKPDGVLIKVVPGDDYLMEVRQAVQPLLRSEGYQNQRVLDHLQAHAQVLEQVTVRQTLPLTPEQSMDFLRMTPMTMTVPRDALLQTQLDHITIHMELLRCRML